MSRYVVSVFTVLSVAFVSVNGRSTKCEVHAHIDSGALCGTKRWAGNGIVYASFRGVPYAKQPLRELRFKELQPAEPWDDVYDASVEGPVCPQHDVLYGPLMQSRNMSEDCIRVNVHVPINALPGYPTTVREGLPIVVFVHGGGFAFGSGDSDMHGPEFLIRRGVIVITFNYRINVFGYFFLNSPYFPGNNGLRDIITLLRWVKTNAKHFGGNPENITLAGQSAGAVSVHLLTLSDAAKGLFKRAILMSGTAIPTFFTMTPIYAQFISNQFLTVLGINSTDPEDVHRQLITMPIERITLANQLLQDQIGVTAFLPVVETTFPGITTVIDEDPEVLMAKGAGKDVPLLVGFTSAECETFRPNFEKLDMLGRIKDNPLLLLPIDLIYKLPQTIALESVKKIEERYFNGSPTMDKYVTVCTDMYYKYPALELAKIRMSMEDAAPMYLYEFSYNAEFNIIKETKGLNFKGAAHIEDMTFIFRTNSMQDVSGFYPPAAEDQAMRIRMTWFMRNFMVCDDPTCLAKDVSPWPPVNNSSIISYQNIFDPPHYSYEKITQDQYEMLQFFESLFNITRT